MAEKQNPQKEKSIMNQSSNEKLRDKLLNAVSNEDIDRVHALIKEQLTDQLFDAVLNEDIDRVHALINEGADVNAEKTDEKRFNSYNPTTVLFIAVKKKNEELVRTLLQSVNIDVNRKDYYGDVVLRDATSFGCLEIVEALLLTKKVDVNVGCKKHGTTPLHVASGRGNDEIVEALLKYPGIQVNQKDKYGSTSLHECASKGHTEVVELLLDVPRILVNEKEDFHSHTPLHLATDFRHEDAVEALLSHPDIEVNVQDKYGQTPLHTSAYHGDLKVVEMLLAAGIDVNEKNRHGQTAVYWAAKQGHTRVVETIVNHVKEVAASGGKSSQVKVQKRTKFHKEKIGNNMKANDPNVQLLLGARNNDLGKVEELLKDPNIDVNSIDKNKNTPLHLASQKGHIEIVKTLLKVDGIDLNAKNRDKSKLIYPIHPGDDPARAKLDIGVTPLHLAVDAGHLEVVKVLVNQPGIDVNAKDKYGTCPLMPAVAKSKLDIIEVLLNHPKIEVNVVDVCNDHFSLLHTAAEVGNIEVVKKLLSHPNIDVNIKDKFYRIMPLDLAVRNNHLQIIEAILNHPKVDVNALEEFPPRDFYGSSENAGIIKRLIDEAKSKMNIRDIGGKTPTELHKRRA